METDLTASCVAPSLGSLPVGAHLSTPRRGYTHHGIYVGSGRVVHYAGLSRSWRYGPVEEVTLEEFARGRPLQLSNADSRFHGEEVVSRAQSRLGERRYRLLRNNCEHFCAWCTEGTARSEQVEHWLDLPKALARAVRLAIRAQSSLMAST